MLNGSLDLLRLDGVDLFHMYQKRKGGVMHDPGGANPHCFRKIQEGVTGDIGGT